MECANAENVSLEPKGLTEDATVWQPAALGKLVNIVRGRSYRSSELKEDSDTALVTLKSFQRGGGYRFDGLKPYVGQYNAEQVVNPGEIVVSQTDITQDAEVIGRPAVVPHHPNYRKLVASLDAAIVRNSDSKRLDYGFLYYRLLSRDYAHHVEARATGTTVLHLSKDALPSFEFLLPPLPEQRRIAEILGALDEKIELNRRTNETMEQMAGALFKSWFVDFDPVYAKAEGRWRSGESLPSLPADLYDLFPERLVASDLGEIPEGWKVSCFGDLAEIVGGSTPSTKESAYWANGTHRFATPKDLSSLSVPILLDTERRITDEGLGRISSGLLPAGTVLMSSRAPIGYLAITQNPVAVNQGFIAMEPKPGIPNSFLLYCTKFSQDEIINRANGSTFLEISKTNFRPIPVLVPGDAIMARYDAVAQSLVDRIVANCKVACELATQRDALLPRLVSGKLKLPVAVEPRVERA